MMLGRFKSTRDPRDPIMRQLVKPSRHPIRGSCRVGGREPLELIIRGSNPKRPSLYVCPVCRSAYSPNYVIGSDEVRHAHARETAIKCCQGRCEICQTPTKKYHSHCEECQKRRSMDRREEWAARAKVVPLDLDAWHYCDHFSGSNDGYFPSFGDIMQELIEADEDAEGDSDAELPDLPPYLIPCEAVTVSFDIQTFEETVSEQIEWDDGNGLDFVRGLGEMHAAIEAFNAANAGNDFCWRADYSRVVILDADYFNRRFGIDRNGLPKTSWSDRPPSIEPYIAARYQKRIEIGREKAVKRAAEWAAQWAAERAKVLA